jgi:hypothetical protein
LELFNGKGVFVRKIIELLTAVFVKTCANSVDFLIFFDFLLKTNRHDETFRCSSMHLEGLKITTSTCGITLWNIDLPFPAISTAMVVHGRAEHQID